MVGFSRSKLEHYSKIAYYVNIGIYIAQATATIIQMTPTSFGLRVGSLSAGHTQAHLITLI